MYIPFEHLPDHARIWIYPADRKFSEADEKIIREEAHSFCDQWVAHGNPLKTSFKIESGHFLILAVDEGVNGASGCSIDGSVRMLKSLQERTGINFLDRSKVPFFVDGNVKLIPLRELRPAFASGILGPVTATFHLLAATKGEWQKDWILSTERTWLAKYLPKNPVT